MKRLFYILLAVLWPCFIVGAGVFTDVDWDELGRDTVMPYYSCQRVLPEDYTSYTYHVVIEYPEFVPVTGEECDRWRLERYRGMFGVWPEVSSSVSSSRGVGMLDIGFVPIVERDGCFYRINSFKINVLRNRVAARGSVRDKTLSEERYSGSSVLSQGYWYKIRVRSTGVYRLTAAKLRAMGFDDPSKVRLYGYGGALLPESGLENMDDDLKEIPLWREGGNILFYGQGPLSWTLESSGRYSHKWNTFSEYGYYFLTACDSIAPAVVKEMETIPDPGEEVNCFTDYLLYEKELFSWYDSGRRFYDSHDFLTDPVSSYQFNLKGLAGDTVMMTVSFSSSGSSASSVKVSVNGNDVGLVRLAANAANEKAALASSAFLCSGMFSENSTVKLLHDRKDGVSGRLDYIRINYLRKLELTGSSLAFRTGNRKGVVHFNISSDKTVVVWNVSSDGTIRLLPSDTQAGHCVTLSVDSQIPGEYVAVDPNGLFEEPEPVGVVPNQNLHSIGATDMVIIVPASGRLTAEAERLAEAHRNVDGLEVVVVPANQIFNEFSSGTPDATAYRRFLKMLYDRDHRLRYLLLFGDGAWDNRMVTPAWTGKNPDEYLLCYESDNSISEVKSYVAEDYYALLEDGKNGNVLSQKIDIGVGRFPVVTVQDAKSMVDKTISYINGNYAGSWQNSVLMLGDDGDGNTHMEQSDKIADNIAAMNPSLNIRKIYWDTYKMEVSASGNSYPEVRRDILKELEKGALLVNYIGHGSPDVLSHELVMDKGDFLKLSSQHLPLWVTASCDIAPFDAAYDMIGKNALLNPVGGALALFATARTVYSSQNYKIAWLFNQNLMNPELALGDVVRETKVQLVTPMSPYQDYSENKVHFVLLGDPALHLALPEHKVVVDTMLTGMVSDEGDPVAAAGSIVTVKGYVQTRSDSLLSGYSGRLDVLVFDSKRHIVSLNNQKAADAPFEFDDYDRVLFSGTDTVSDGRFSFRFPVPKDINYSNDSGRMVLFAIDNAGRTANGFYEDYLVGGTYEFISADTIGPSISLFLNTPDFEYWGMVNNSPCLFAELEDADGINSSGNGIGHDLLLVIDNNPLYTYVLNDYYTPSDYRKGRIVFSIPSLPEGRHTLMLRAWDVLNNSSTVYLGFEVTEELEPEILSADVTENPAKETTSFVIRHNRPGSIESVTVQVYDTKGRLLWTGRTGDSSNGMCIMDWNLCGDNGQRLSSGLYLYKVTVSDTGGGCSSGMNKLIVL
ncbi:MAG: type IX secretion system sortase PorU [Bacteroidaceae bacterium]|nr:type IX secretion system sortase PorU [Bacteroidaceae bacterium]